MLQPAPGQRDWPAALKRLSSFPGTLTAEENAEAGRYELLGHLLGILQSKARRSLKNHRGEGGKKPRTH